MISSEYLGINRDKFIISSKVGDFTKLKGSSKVLAICKEMNASTYINPISGAHLYEKSFFESKGIQLEFLKPVVKELSEKESPVSILQYLITQKKSRISSQLTSGIIQ